MSDYTTVQKVRGTIDSQVAGASDEVIARLITAVSRQIDRQCNRLDGFIAPETASARLYAGSGNPVQYIDECVAISLVEVKAAYTDAAYVAWSASDWIAFSGGEDEPNFNRTPYSGLMVAPSGDQSVFTAGRSHYRAGFRPVNDDRINAAHAVPTVRVTARWGYANAVPPDIENATIIAVARVFKRGEAAFSDLLASNDFGAIAIRAAHAPEVTAILKDGRYIRPRV